MFGLYGRHSCDKMVQVRVSDGVLEGEELVSVLGFHYNSFKGIPYAQPPVGDLRFKAPQPPKPWTGVRSAKEHGPICHQYDMFTKTLQPGSEDCLYLNVYTKDLKPSKPRPVMFWIHGGGFMSGSGNSNFHGPDFLIDKDVILVTFNYRLEVLGFLCLDTEEVPGNAGMKDQVAALRWVNKNIHAFGGDPNNITIFGESAGGASVSFHLVSPMSKGLFKRAIAQSGVFTAPWSTGFELRERAKTLARELGKDTDDDNELYDFFKSLPIEKLVETRPLVTLAETSSPWSLIFWTIADEKNNGKNERFFYGNSDEVLRNGIHEGVEVIVGYNTHEGLIAFGLNTFDDVAKKCDNYLDVLVPSAIVSTTSTREHIDIAKKIKKYYFGKSKASNDWKPLEKYSAMNVFIFNIIEFAKILSTRSKVYLYKFTGHSERNIFASLLAKNIDLGQEETVCHADDLMYLFQINDINLPIVKESKGFQIIENITRLWTNFAKYGNPTPDGSLGAMWTPFSANKQEYLEIKEKLLNKTFPEKDEFEFWENIFKEYLKKQ